MSVIFMTDKVILIGAKACSDQLPLYVLAGTRLTLKTGVKTLGGRISFLPRSLPGKKSLPI